MGGNEKEKKKPSRRLLVLIALLIILMVELGVLAITHLSGSSRGTAEGEEQLQTSEAQPAATEPQTETSELQAVSEPQMVSSEEVQSLEQQPEAAFPIVLEDGKLEVESLFQFSGINPDAEQQQATDAAAIVLKNTSDEYLKTATVRVVLRDGSERTFVVCDLPAGAAAIVFDVDNSVLSASDACVDIVSEAVFETVGSSDGISCSVDGTEITLENVSEEDLTQIEVYCRNVFNDEYFGGVAYKYTIESLAKGESTTIIASDCILGIADVVRISVNDQK